MTGSAWWLAEPSRYAAVYPTRARALLAILTLLVLVSWTAVDAPNPLAANGRAADGTDLQLYQSITDAMRHGGEYYATAADALRAGHYPLKPFVTFRLPTLAIVQASLPPILTPALLYLLAASVTIAWSTRFRAAFRRPLAWWSAILLLTGGAVACWQAALAPIHELWAGLLIALSLARHRPGRWMEAVGWGLAAAVVRETAALYLLVMLAVTWHDGARREAIGWAAALGVLMVVIAAHAYAVAQVVGPLDPASPGWTGLLGPGFAVRSWYMASALSLLPLALAAPIVVLALAGWTAWNDPLGLRVAATLAAYAMLLATAARPDNFYWGLLTVPVLLIGLAFVPDGLRDLTSSALDRRRITVRRVPR